MRKTVGALVVVVSLLWALPVASLAAVDLPHKYGLELQLGGGYLNLADVNDYLPAQSFNGLKPAQKINIGAQFGFGLLYRQMMDFGWQIGYNHFISVVDSKFRISDGRIGAESWAEQTLSGGELYALATWYWPWKQKEIFFGIGPALYSASMDRSVDLVSSDGGSHITSASFADASGRSFGLLTAVGIELPLKQDLGLAIQLGGRLGKVSKLTYTDSSDREITVPLNSSSNASFPVDFSGVFVKINLRGYFQPASDWRNPSR